MFSGWLNPSVTISLSYRHGHFFSIRFLTQSASDHTTVSQPRFFPFFFFFQHIFDPKYQWPYHGLWDHGCPGVKCLRKKKNSPTDSDMVSGVCWIRMVTGGLKMLNVWGYFVSSLQKASLTLPGDILLVTAYVSYVGCFTKSYRNELLQKCWLPFLRKLKVLKVSVAK